MTTIDLKQMRSDLNEYAIICEKYQHCLEKYGDKLNNEGCKDACRHGIILKNIDPINSNIMLYNCQNHSKSPLCFLARKDLTKDIEPVMEKGPHKYSDFKL